MKKATDRLLLQLATATGRAAAHLPSWLWHGGLQSSDWYSYIFVFIIDRRQVNTQ